MAEFPTVVLAGGEGRRMGGGKPLRLLKGKPLIAQATDLARSWSRDIAVAVRDPAQVGPVDAPVLRDLDRISGPLAGLASALSWAAGLGHDRVLVIPCDTPRLPGNLAERLNNALAPGAGAAMPRSQGRLHPACCLWRTATFDLLMEEVAAGRGSLRNLAERANCVVVDWADGAAFANVNTPFDLAAMEADAS